MRKRSEISKKPSAVPKSSAQERTVEMPLAPEGGVIKCKQCDEVSPAKGATVRADGKVECPACGAPCKVEAGESPKPEPAKVPTSLASNPVPREASREDMAGSVRVQDLPKAYCDTCGAHWPRLADGKPHPNCGHVEGFVYDPAKAKSYNPPAGHQRLHVVRDEPKPSPTPFPTPTIEPVHVGRPTVAVQGDSVFVGWGKCMFRVGEFSTFTVGPFTMSTTLAPGENKVAAAERMLAELKQIADRAFSIEAAWYAEKLGVAPKIG